MRFVEVKPNVFVNPAHVTAVWPRTRTFPRRTDAGFLVADRTEVVPNACEVRLVDGKGVYGNLDPSDMVRLLAKDDWDERIVSSE